jgi:hypothetical protein
VHVNTRKIDFLREAGLGWLTETVAGVLTGVLNGVPDPGNLRRISDVQKLKPEYQGFR